MCQLLSVNMSCCCRSSPIWQRVRLSGTCAWWTCIPLVAYPPMPVVSLTPYLDLKLLWAQLKTFPTGNQHYHSYTQTHTHTHTHTHYAAVDSKHFGYSFNRRGNLPWLYYGDEPGLASRVLQTDPVPIGFSFRGRNKVIDLNHLYIQIQNSKGKE